MAESLEIVGYGGELVPNRFIRNEESANVLAILLPGKGYTTSMPLLYYAENFGTDRGWDILRVDYNYLRSNLTDEELVTRLVADSGASITAGLQHGNYDRVVVFGKSIGTIAMANATDQLAGKDVHYVWLTPLLRVSEIRDAIAASGDQSLVVIGMADTQYDAGILAELKRAGVTNHIVEGADHGMDIPGNVPASISALGSVYDAVNGFLDVFGRSGV